MAGRGETGQRASSRADRLFTHHIACRGDLPSRRHATASNIYSEKWVGNAGETEFRSRAGALLGRRAPNRFNAGIHDSHGAI